MDLKWFFKIILLIPIIVHSQNREFKGRGISVEASTLILFPYDFRIASEHNEISETGTKSKILGTSIHLDYYISKHFAFRAKWL